MSPSLASMFNVALEQAEENLDSYGIGENLLVNSGGTSLTRDSSAWEDRIDVIDGKTALVFNHKQNISNFSQDYELIPGETYTFSFKAKATKPLNLRSIYVNRMNSGLLPNQSISTEWETYSVTFVAKNNPRTIEELSRGDDNLKGPNYTLIHIYPNLGNTDAKEHEFYLTELKLEFGDRATKWIK